MTFCPFFFFPLFSFSIFHPTHFFVLVFSFEARVVPHLSCVPSPHRGKKKWNKQPLHPFLSLHTHVSFSLSDSHPHPIFSSFSRLVNKPCEQSVYKLLWQPLPFWRRAWTLHGKQKHRRIRLQLQNKQPRKKQSHFDGCWLCEVRRVQPPGLCK